MLIKTLLDIAFKSSDYFSSLVIIGLTSICEDGIKHGNPSTFAINPPLTFPVIYPVISSFVSKTFSIRFQDFILRALSLEITISPLKLSIFSKKTSIGFSKESYRGRHRSYIQPERNIIRYPKTIWSGRKGAEKANQLPTHSGSRWYRQELVQTSSRHHSKSGKVSEDCSFFKKAEWSH